MVAPLNEYMKRLTLAYKGRDIVSSIFNFKTYRTMAEILDNGKTIAALDEAADAGLIAIFDGTQITADSLTGDWRNFDSAELSRARNMVLRWFNAVRPRKTPDTDTKIPDDPILSLYRTLLFEHSLLPSEIDEQDPQLLIDVMIADPAGINDNGISDAAKSFFGL